MKKLLITGGTVFVSRYLAEYFLRQGWEVSVLNRGSRPQSPGVKLIKADRNDLGDVLRPLSFDAVIDTGYTGQDVSNLLGALNGFEDYVFISSSAVYMETALQPFTEESPVGPNGIWGKYGTDKLSAERALQSAFPNAYILRPPYIYGPMNNVYREAFVFDCALSGRKFYLPQNGEMKLQFCYIEDMCRFIQLILEKKPARHIWNVGSSFPVSVKDWVSMCYHTAGKKAEFVSVPAEIPQRSYFSFYNYEYFLDVTAQHELMPEETPLSDGLMQAFLWYREHPGLVNKKPLLEFIDSNLA